MLPACPAIEVPIQMMASIVKVESAFNPYAIGVVGDSLVRQPKNMDEAIATVKELEKEGLNFSVGLAQVNRYNLKKYGILNYESAFDSCTNLVAGSKILKECYQRSGDDWGKALSCYYSGNFVVGFKHGYVQKVAANFVKIPSQPIELKQSISLKSGLNQNTDIRISKNAFDKKTSDKSKKLICTRLGNCAPSDVKNQSSNLNKGDETFIF